MKVFRQIPLGNFYTRWTVRATFLYRNQKKLSYQKEKSILSNFGKSALIMKNHFLPKSNTKL